MITLQGTYNTAVIYTDMLESAAEGQIRAMLEQPFCVNSRIRIMPDVHAGKGCTIGTTMTVTDKAVPNMVGVDIGCGMETVKLNGSHIELPKLDSVIKRTVPSGFNVRPQPHRRMEQFDFEKLRCFGSINLKRAAESLGTLGGGNHFIEVDRGGDDLFLVIHTGSRNPGLQVAEYYQKLAYERMGGRELSDVPYELAWLSGPDLEDYLHDMELMQRFADLNRKTIKEEILSGMKLKEEGSFTTVHNYIDTEAMILRKGAVSAGAGEQLLIPMNMRDGSLICTGLGNQDWNCSAPHGAGRLMSRGEAKNHITLSAFKKSMEGIYTSTVSKATLDEAPMVYKSMEQIMEAITETVRIERIIKPVYNFKAAE